jgi:hypothetical protein
MIIPILLGVGSYESRNEQNTRRFVYIEKLQLFMLFWGGDDCHLDASK